MESVVKVNPAFELRGLSVPIDKILPLKKIITDAKRNATLRRVISSVKEVGIIEPLIVRRQGGGRTYSLLDGHVRLEALRQLEESHAPCLLSTEDEAYTYNHKVNVVPPIQEHFMIMKAIESGVSEERIAAALDLDISSIRQKRDLLNGICPEAVSLLRERSTPHHTFRELRKAKPMRQIEIAELMIAMHNFTAQYARCLIIATPDEQLVEPIRSKVPKGMKPEELARMEREMEHLNEDFHSIEDHHGKNTLNLVLSTGYLRRLLDNSRVVRFLSSKHPDILSEFQKLVESSSLERGS